MNYKATYLKAVWFAGLIFLGLGCGSSDKTVVERSDERGYISTTGSELAREQIKESFESIKRIHNTVTYQTYVFDPSDYPTQEMVQTAGPQALAISSETESHSTAGTVAILANHQRKTTFLTAAHVVSFADTIWHRSEDRERIEAVSVKTSLVHFMFVDNGIHTLDVAITDQRRDLALMVLDWSGSSNPRLQALSLQAGNPDELDWTDMVYALGYPRGFQMVTRGMVSKFMTIPRRSFVIDAPFNRGFSGGMLFTIRRDGTGLEWVGVLSAAYAETEYFLSPGEIDAEDFNPNVPYDGPLFLQREKRLNYGITYAVGMEEIGAFFRENSREIERLGLSVPDVPY